MFVYLLTMLVFVAAPGLSLVAASGSYPLVAACRLLIAVTSLVAERGLLRYTGLVAPWHVESSQTRDGTHVLCIGRWILSHQTTRKVQ